MRTAKAQDSAAKKKQADIEQVSEEARKTREAEDVSRAARTAPTARRPRACPRGRRSAARAQAAVVVPATASTQEGDLVDIENCDTPPVSTRQVSPQVPVMAKQRRVSGTVLLRVLVDETGKPAKVESCGT